MLPRWHEALSELEVEDDVRAYLCHELHMVVAEQVTRLPLRSHVCMSSAGELDTISEKKIPVHAFQRILGSHFGVNARSEQESCEVRQCLCQEAIALVRAPNAQDQDM